MTAFGYVSFLASVDVRFSGTPRPFVDISCLAFACLEDSPPVLLRRFPRPANGGEGESKGRQQSGLRRLANRRRVAIAPFFASSLEAAGPNPFSSLFVLACPLVPAFALTSRSNAHQRRFYGWAVLFYRALRHVTPTAMATQKKKTRLKFFFFSRKKTLCD